MTPHRALAPYDWAAILDLIRTEFAYMEPRIDPPSSIDRLTPEDIAVQADEGEVWVIGDALACMFLTPKAETLYLGKLAVRGDQRGRGLARVLVQCAQSRALALGFGTVELQTRVELVENLAIFRALGFVETTRTAHDGYASPTSITFRKPSAGA